MTFQRQRGTGTWEEVKAMLIAVGRHFLDFTDDPIRDGPFLYGEGGLAIWKRIQTPYDLGKAATMALDKPGFDDQRWEDKGDTENIIGNTHGGSNEESEWLGGIVSFGLEEKDAPETEIEYIGETKDSFTGVLIRKWGVHRPGRFEVLFEFLTTYSRANYYYIYRRDGWLSPVIDGRFQGARHGISARGEGLYWNFVWTEEPLNGDSLLWGGEQEQLDERFAGLRKHRTIKSARDFGGVWVWGYVPLEEILWMDYSEVMHLTANRCKVVGAMLAEGLREEEYGDVHDVGYLAASDTGRGRFIPLVEYLQNQGWI